MNNISYSKAYTQVLALLENLPQEEYHKISKSEIEFFEQNKDSNYIFTLEHSKSLAEQNISIQTNSIIVRLFRDYFANENQRKNLQMVLKHNSQRAEEEKRKKYSTELFKKN